MHHETQLMNYFKPCDGDELCDATSHVFAEDFEGFMVETDILMSADTDQNVPGPYGYQSATDPSDL